jgi:hypothetical protein
MVILHPATLFSRRSLFICYANVPIEHRRVVCAASQPYSLQQCLVISMQLLTYLKHLLEINLIEILLMGTNQRPLDGRVIFARRILLVKENTTLETYL